MDTALESSDTAELLRLFASGGFWRDHLALTWDFRSVQGNKELAAFLDGCKATKEGFRLRSIALDKSSPLKVPQMSSLDAAGNLPCLLFFFALETKLGSGQGMARLILEEGSWKIYSLYTAPLQQLKDHGEAINAWRPRGVDHSGQPGPKSWADRRKKEVAYHGTDPTVIMLGKYLYQAPLIRFILLTGL